MKEERRSVPLLFLLPVFLLCSCGREAPEELIPEYIQAKKLYSRWNLREAEEKLREISGSSPRFHQAKLMLAKTLLFSGKEEETKEILEDLLDHFPMYREAEILLVRLLVKTGNLEEASERSKGMLAYDSSDPRLLYLMGVISEEREDLSSAIGFYKKALLFEQQLARTHMDLGRIYYRFGMRDLARKELEQSISLLPKSSILAKAVYSLLKEVEIEE